MRYLRNKNIKMYNKPHFNKHSTYFQEIIDDLAFRGAYFKLLGGGRVEILRETFYSFQHYYYCKHGDI